MTAPGDVEVSDRADELLETPRAHLALTLRQDEDGMIVALGGEVLVRCRLTPGGMAAAGLVARALGAPVPAAGAESTARVSTGVLFRAASIARLDLSNEASMPLLERLLEEAAAQRGGAPAGA